jgi:hypothetical protein
VDFLSGGWLNFGHYLPGHFAVLDYQDLARAIERLEKGSGVSSNENKGQ